MRCEHCGYRLWLLLSRRCPECGTEFKPSDFEFVPHAVQFCCPHCNQAYYGTSSQGHLRPIEFDCVSCGRHIHMDEMVMMPTDGVDEEQLLDRADEYWRDVVGSHERPEIDEEKKRAVMDVVERARRELLG